MPRYSPALFVFLLLACLGICSAAVEVPAPGAFLELDLRNQAVAAFQQGDFEKAEGLLLAYERDFGEETSEEIATFIKKSYALIALCQITNGRPADAAPYIDKALQHKELLTLPVYEELSYWQAVLLLQAGDFRAAQQAFGEFFAQSRFPLARRLEALSIFGTCYVMQGYHRTAAEFFAHQIPNLRKAKGGAAYVSRATVLRMISLVQAEQYDEAFAWMLEVYPRLEELDQMVTFQMMALSLASHYMDEEKPYQAIACMQRIWPAERLLTRQREKLSALEQSYEELKENSPLEQAKLFQLDGTIQRIKREIENFESIPDFDAALRLRMAMAFQQLERYREAALIMEDMLQRMEPSPVVESASLAVIQCWSQLQRWPRAVKAAENYLQAFGDDATNKNLPQVLFMQADAMMQQELPRDAEGVFANIARSFPDHPLSNKARFMSGFCQLQQDDNEKAIQTFSTVMENEAKDSSLYEDAFFWTGNAYSYSQLYAEAKAHMADYLETFGKGKARYESQAAFRMAYCTFCEADYPASISEFRTFLADYGPSAPDRDEAYLLLGDALLGEGEADDGIAAYSTIRPESTRFFEDGYFKTGKAYKLLEEVPTMRQHYQDFLEKYPDSKRMPEAVYWIGWTHVHTGELDLAKKAYWDTIVAHGDNPELYAIEELLMGLPKIYKRGGPDAMSELSSALFSQQIAAEKAKKATLHLRLLWANAMLKRREGKDQDAAILLLRVAHLVDPEIHNPQIVADAADALAAKGDYKVATKLYHELRKWNPISFLKARAYKGLGMIAQQQKDYDEAIRQYRAFEKQAAASTELADIQLRRIGLQMQQKDNASSDVVADLEALLENPVASSEHKAKAIYLIGEKLYSDGAYLKSTAYYERVYVIYGKYRDLVAKSYYRRGEALEQLDEKTKAYEVYHELAHRKDLADYREAQLGRRRMDALSAFAPTEEEDDEKGGQP